MSDRNKQRDRKTAEREDGVPAERDVGNALRAVYAKTVDEDIPPDLLDLLGKLD